MTRRRTAERLAFPAPRDGERVPVMCWCERRMGLVPVERVRAGETFSCGAPDCSPPAHG